MTGGACGKQEGDQQTGTAELLIHGSTQDVGETCWDIFLLVTSDSDARAGRTIASANGDGTYSAIKMAVIVLMLLANKNAFGKVIQTYVGNKAGGDRQLCSAMLEIPTSQEGKVEDAFLCAWR